MANLSMVGVVLPLAKAIRTSLQVLLRGADRGLFFEVFASQKTPKNASPMKQWTPPWKTTELGRDLYNTQSPNANVSGVNLVATKIPANLRIFGRAERWTKIWGDLTFEQLHVWNATRNNLPKKKISTCLTFRTLTYFTHAFPSKFLA